MNTNGANQFPNQDQSRRADDSFSAETNQKHERPPVIAVSSTLCTMLVGRLKSVSARPKCDARVAASEKLSSDVIVMTVDARQRLNALRRVKVRRFSVNRTEANLTGRAIIRPNSMDEVWVGSE
jgi:hypothetical protein